MTTDALSRGSRRFQPSSWYSLAANAMAALSSSFCSPCPVGESGGADALAVGLQIIPPAIAEIGPQILERALGVDIAVEDADARLAAVLGAMHGLSHLDVHRASSLRESADHRSQADSPPG